MAFDIRCPECKAKLRLDEAPEPDTPIECPRCGSQFAPPDEAPAGKKGGGGKKEKKKGAAPKKRKAKKKKTNPVFLLIAIGVGFVLLVAVGGLLVWVTGRASSATEMLTYVPAECNWARGVNTGQLAGYPGYADQVTKFNTAPVRAASDDLAKAAGHEPTDFLNYLVIAKSRQHGGTGTMYVIQSRKAFKPAELGAAIPGSTPVTVNGETCYRGGPNAGGILAGATVFMPTNRIIVIVPPGPMQNQLASGSVGGKSDKKNTFAGTLDATGKLVIRGSIWLVVKSSGALDGYIAANTTPVESAFGRLHEKAKVAKTFGVWSTPGGNGVRVGAAMECASEKDAEELVKFFRSGPLGKEDESEPPNELKRAFSLTGDVRAFGEFMQYIKYRSSRTSAYFVSQVEGENSKKFMNIFNNPNMAAGESQGGGGFGGPGPPGLPGGP